MSRLIPPNPNLPPDISELEMLSAYLDNALPEIERAAVEQRLSTEPTLRAALEALRGTLTLLKNAPMLAPPRNFTLDPVQYRRSIPGTRRMVWLPMGVISAVAAILLVAFIASQSLSSFTSQLYRPISVTNAPPAIAIRPTVLLTGAALQLNSPTAVASGAAKASDATGSIAPIPASAAATQSAVDSGIHASTTPTHAPIIAAPLRPTTAAAKVTLVLEAATAAQTANNGAASQSGAANTAGGFAGPSVSVPGSPPTAIAPGALLAPTQVAQPIQPAPLPPATNEVKALWIVIYWLLILFGVKGLP
ncbi:MAG: anti-sigma factor family protein [Aggregatilineales bacterium]